MTSKRRFHSTNKSVQTGFGTSECHLPNHQVQNKEIWWQRQLTDGCLDCRYKCAEHWAKVDLTATGTWFDKIKQRLRERYPIGEFNVLRTRMDPHNILASKALGQLFDTKEA